MSKVNGKARNAGFLASIERRGESRQSRLDWAIASSSRRRHAIGHGRAAQDS